jgi:aldose 1-epimerase
MTLSGLRYEIGHGRYRARISQHGGGLAGLWAGDRPVTSPSPDGALPLMSNGAALLPWPNRIRDGRYEFEGVTHQLPLSEPANHNASHGLARWVAWTLLEQDEAGVLLGLDLVPQTGYEFELALRLRYSLTDDGLRVDVGAANVGLQPAPFGAGFHPYLDLDGHDVDHAELELPAATVLFTDDRQLPVRSEPVAGSPYDLQQARPVGTLRLDHCYTDLTGNRARVAVADWHSELWWDESFSYVQAFTPPERFGRTAIAVEPMTCPANAFNSGDGLIRLEPGQNWTGSWGISSS